VPACVAPQQRIALSPWLERALPPQERLKEALDENRGAQLGFETEPETWMEYFFGICRPNGRLGKLGSRSVEPACPSLRPASLPRDTLKHIKVGHSIQFEFLLRLELKPFRMDLNLI
jgi:hypothetical protein